ncbi:uncharacterized protein LOC117303586 [Asterias rubens]|uniref:uncharacterized protein LOC117303586 n=1 Tax=Asterias rubens TaxID=7604 RepID=UPI001454E60D|nr:uncharacterized protein LOC117303586 [Asterias rubens]
MKLLLLVLVAVLLLVPDTGAWLRRRRRRRPAVSSASIARFSKLESMAEGVVSPDGKLTVDQPKKTTNNKIDTSPAGYFAVLQNVVEGYRESKMHVNDGGLDVNVDLLPEE